MNPPIQPPVNVKVVNGHFVTVLPYIPPVTIDKVWWFRKPKFFVYDGPSLLNDYIQTRDDSESVDDLPIID